MTRDEIVVALRCHCDAIETGKCPKDKCPMFEMSARYKCAGVLSGEAANLIENQQRHIEALMKANDSLKDAIARRYAQIEKMSAELADARNEIKIFYNGYDQLDASNSRLMAANEKLAADRQALVNELCQYCGKYKQAHEGACDGCRWKQ